MHANNEIIECPICYDEIIASKNCVTTECGHTFHCSCLMKNSVTNGFSCPMCREKMAEEPEDEDDEDDEDESVWTDEDESIEDDALTSFRMFHQRLNGEEVEDEPEPEEEAEEAEEEAVPRPTAAQIAAKLAEQGVTIEDLVKCLLVEHEEYDPELETNDRKSGEMFGQFRIIISNYPRLLEEQRQERQRQRQQVEQSFGQVGNRFYLWSNDADEV
jgi:hypothetical protein